MLNFAQIGAISGYTSRGYDEDYQAWLDELTVQTYTHPSADVNSILSTMVAGIKSDGNWTELDRFWFFAHDGSSDTGVVDMINASGHAKATKVNSPGWTAKEGFNSNGSSSYLNLNFNTSTATYLTQNSASIGVWLHTGGNNLTGVNTNIFGSRNASVDFITLFDRGSAPTVPSGTLNSNVSDDYSSITQFNNNSSYAVERTSSTNVNLYKDGSLNNNHSNTSTSEINLDLFALARNNTGTPQFYAVSTWKLSALWAGSSNVNQSQMHTRLSTAMTAIAAL